MKGLLGRARRIFRNQGGIRLVLISARYLFFRCRDLATTFKRLPTVAYYHLQGETALTTNGISARFESGYGTGFLRLRFRFKSEGPVLADFLGRLQPDDVFWDVGAGIGLHACFGLGVIECGAIVAYEPYPPNVRQLRQNVNRNGPGDSIQVVSRPLSDSTRTITFIQPADAEVGYGGGGTTHESGDTSVEREAVSGDELVDRGVVPEPTVVKIDVEGAELEVIEGMERVLDDPACELIYVEVHRSDRHARSENIRSSQSDELESRLSEFGFAVEVIHTRGEECFLRGTK